MKHLKITSKAPQKSTRRTSPKAPQLALNRLWTLLTAFLLCLTPLKAFALTEAELDMYNRNGIYYYDPMSRTCRQSGDISVYGTTVTEKIWTGLTSFMTDEQAAGVMGNMAHESGFNPAQHEMALLNEHQPGFDIGANSNISYGLGLIQWSFGRRVGLVNYVKSQDPSMLTYLEDYKTYSYTYLNGDQFLEIAGEEATNALISLELSYLKDELENNSAYSGIFKTFSVYDAAKYFLEHIEVPQNPYIDSHPERATDAQAFYDQFHNKNISSSSSSKTFNKLAAYIIGDSITVGATDALNNTLEDAVIDAKGARPFETGLQILQTADLGDYPLVFALGTNSPWLKKEQIEQVVELAGNRNIFFLTNYGTYDYTSNNQLFQEVADTNRNVYLIDWAAKVGADPDKYLWSDHIHPNEEGQQLFADLIKAALEGKLRNSNGCATTYGDAGALQEYVKGLAWPEYHPASYVQKMPDYATLVEERIAAGKYVGGISYPGIDCGGWVTSLLQVSGFEPNYNEYMGATDTQEQWAIDHGWTLLNGSAGTEIDTSVLEPGDVAFTTGHTFIYVGEIDGFDSNIASASLDERAPMAGRESLTYGKGVYVRWYRKG